LTNTNREVLKGLDDNYIHIGGDSISAMRLVATARREGLEVSVGDIFKHTLLELARSSQKSVERSSKVLDQRPCSTFGITNPDRFIREEISPRIPLEDFNIIDVLPTTGTVPTSYHSKFRGSHLSFYCLCWTDLMPTGSSVTRIMYSSIYSKELQEASPTNFSRVLEYQRIFIEYQKCTFVAINIPRSVDEVRMRRATQAVVEKYNTLQTVFLPYQDNIVQVIISQDDRYFSVHKVDQDPMSISESICREDNQVPYGTPSFQLKLISRGESHNALILRISHALYDGLSIFEIFHDLSAAYEGSPIGSPASTYSMYMQYRLAQRTETAYDFWREFLDNSTMTNLDRDVLGDDRAETHEVEECVQRIIKLPVPPSGITMSTLFKAAWSFVLASISRKHDLVFGQVVSGRNIPMDGVEDVYGACINYAPVRVTIDTSWTALRLMHHISEQHTRTTPFETIDLQDIVTNCTPWPNGTDFGCLVHYRAMTMPKEVSLDGHTCEATPLSFYPVKKYFTVTASPVDGSLEICVEASNKLVGRESADRIAGDICDTVLRFVTHPNEILPFPVDTVW